jgi:quercetin dioxygenase-like cupin family protein
MQPSPNRFNTRYDVVNKARPTVANSPARCRNWATTSSVPPSARANPPTRNPFQRNDRRAGVVVVDLRGSCKAVGMRIRTTIIFVITAACVATAQGQDPAVVNAKTIKVRFENDRVRVLEANLPPGVKEQVHSHPAYIIYVLEGGRYRNYASDGKVAEGELKAGEVLFREPLTHAAENIGDKPLHMILVELKGEKPKEAATSR